MKKVEQFKKDMMEKNAEKVLIEVSEGSIVKGYTVYVTDLDIPNARACDIEAIKLGIEKIESRIASDMQDLEKLQKDKANIIEELFTIQEKKLTNSPRYATLQMHLAQIQISIAAMVAQLSNANFEYHYLIHQFELKTVEAFLSEDYCDQVRKIFGSMGVQPEDVAELDSKYVGNYIEKVTPHMAALVAQHEATKEGIKRGTLKPIIAKIYKELTGKSIEKAQAEYMAKFNITKCSAEDINVDKEKLL